MQKINNTKTQKGITLIALIMTIIIMMILVGVSVSVALDGGLFETAKLARDKTELAKQEELELSSMGTWIQSKTTVKELISGKILQVGATVTNYNAGGKTWQVLGAENGKLLLTTKDEVGSITLEGKTGMWDETNKKLTTLEDELHNECKEAIGDIGTDAQSIRSIKAEDIDRITGYKPTIGETKTVTGEDLPNGKDKMTITEKRYIDIDGDDANFYKGANYLSKDDSAYIMLFGDNVDPMDSNTGKNYWLASSFADNCYNSISVGLCNVMHGEVDGYNGVLWNESGVNYRSITNRIRPVVVLNSSFVPEV